MSMLDYVYCTHWSQIFTRVRQNSHFIISEVMETGRGATSDNKFRIHSEFLYYAHDEKWYIQFLVNIPKRSISPKVNDIWCQGHIPEKFAKLGNLFVYYYIALHGFAIFHAIFPIARCFGCKISEVPHSFAMFNVVNSTLIKQMH